MAIRRCCLGAALGGATLALLVFQQEARAACVDTSLSTANNCELFTSASGNNFAFDVWSAALQTASTLPSGEFQVVLDGLRPGQTFNVTGMQLVLTGSLSSTTVNLADKTYSANNTFLPSEFYAAASFSGLGIGQINDAVLTGTFGVTSPVAAAPPTSFFAGLRFNSTGSSTGGLLDIAASGGAAFGQNSLGSQYVPGPLPVLGAGIAFGFSRRLRRRISAS